MCIRDRTIPKLDSSDSSVKTIPKTWQFSHNHPRTWQFSQNHPRTWQFRQFSQNHPRTWQFRQFSQNHPRTWQSRQFSQNHPTVQWKPSQNVTTLHQHVRMWQTSQQKWFRAQSSHVVRFLTESWEIFKKVPHQLSIMERSVYSYDVSTVTSSCNYAYHKNSAWKALIWCGNCDHLKLKPITLVLYI